MAAEELIRRADAAESLIAFTEYTYDRYRTAAHHRQIAEQLERVERGEVDRLMLLVPPRHGKSELASIRWPAWYLGRQPHKQFLSISATAELAADFGRAVRNVINAAEYKAVFDTTLAEDSQAKGKWHTKDGGIYYSLGIGGSVLGRGGDAILIDDPFGSMREARSELERKNVFEFYSGTLYNRLMPGGAIVVINHRMHEDDLCGMLLNQQAAGGDKWEVVKLPALSDDGEALWPERYPVDVLERIRRNTFPRDWSALYQQEPTPDEGDFFKSDWLKDYTPAKPAPELNTLQVYGASDYAVTQDGGDYTVHGVLGIDPQGEMHLLDLWRKQTTPDKWIDTFCDMVRRYKPLEWAEETGQIKSGVGPFRDKRMAERNAYVTCTAFPTRGDKAVRATSMRGRMSQRGLYVDHNAPWFADFRSELLSFPAGKHDDQVDMIGLLGQLLDNMVDGVLPKAKEGPKNPSGYSAIDDYDSEELSAMDML